MPPVSMKMAKLQKSTLDPAKIAGRCGRLKCCLRYEHDTYASSEQRLPSRGARVLTPHGTGRVIDVELLAERVHVEIDGPEARRLVLGGGEILGTLGPATRRPRSPGPSTDA
jgi:cell fate regulator YaaT (PSP1 superfamily)